MTSRLAQELADHRSFLLRLARRLVRDEASADDLVQETLLQALVHRVSRRPWLAAVLRRQASRRRRARGRREDRELRAAAREGTADLVGQLDRRLDVQMVLLEEVRALPPELSRALMLRYMDGLSPSEIAASLDEPLATVKSRLSRGLARLRLGLDRRHAGDRQSWLAALALLPLPKARAAAAWGMAKLGLGLTVVATIAVALGLDREEAPGRPDASEPRHAALRASAPDTAATESLEPGPTTSPTPDGERSPAAIRVAGPPPDGLHGRVLSEAIDGTHRARPDTVAFLIELRGQQPDRASRRDLALDAGGGFRILQPPPALDRWVLVAAAGGYRPRALPLSAPDEGGDLGGLILRREGVLSGTVHQGRHLAPEGALVQGRLEGIDDDAAPTVLEARGDFELSWWDGGPEWSRVSARVDEAGRYELSGLAPRRHVLSAPRPEQPFLSMSLSAESIFQVPDRAAHLAWTAAVLRLDFQDLPEFPLSGKVRIVTPEGTSPPREIELRGNTEDPDFSLHVPSHRSLELSAVLDGMERVEESVHPLTEGEERSVVLRLRRDPESAALSLRLLGVGPEDGSRYFLRFLRIDGEGSLVRGARVERGLLHAGALPPGEWWVHGTRHSASSTDTGFRHELFARRVLLVAGERAELPVEMVRPGNLALFARDSAGQGCAAQVELRRLDGLLVGGMMKEVEGGYSSTAPRLSPRSPMTFRTAIPPGRYLVRFTLEGHEAHELEAEVRSGETTPVEVRLHESRR